MMRGAETFIKVIIGISILNRVLGDPSPLAKPIFRHVKKLMTLIVKDHFEDSDSEEDQNQRAVRSPIPQLDGNDPESNITLQKHGFSKDGFSVSSFNLGRKQLPKEEEYQQQIDKLLENQFDVLRDMISSEPHSLFWVNKSSPCDQKVNFVENLEAVLLKPTQILRDDCFGGMLLKYVILPYYSLLSKHLDLFDTDDVLTFSRDHMLENIRTIAEIDNFLEIGSPLRDQYILTNVLESLLQSRMTRVEAQLVSSDQKRTMEKSLNHSRFIILLLGIISSFSIIFYIVSLCRCCCTNERSRQADNCLARYLFKKIAAIPENELAELRREHEHLPLNA